MEMIKHKFNKQHVAQQLQHLTEPSTLHLLALLIDSLMLDMKYEETSGAEGMYQGYSAETVKHLCLALQAEQNAKVGEMEARSRALQGEDAEAYLNECLLVGYRGEYPDTPADSGDLPVWPDKLPRDVLLSKAFLMKLGYTMGYYAAVRDKVMDDFYSHYATGVVV